MPFTPDFYWITTDVGEDFLNSGVDETKDESDLVLNGENEDEIF